MLALHVGRPKQRPHRISKSVPGMKLPIFACADKSLSVSSLLHLHYPSIQSSRRDIQSLHGKFQPRIRLALKVCHASGLVHLLVVASIVRPTFWVEVSGGETHYDVTCCAKLIATYFWENTTFWLHPGATSHAPSAQENANSLETRWLRNIGRRRSTSRSVSEGVPVRFGGVRA